MAKERAIYRVWFLGREVQCGVKMVRPDPPTAAAPDAGFTGGCVSGVCTREPKAKRQAAMDSKSAPAAVPTAASPAPQAASEFTGGCVGGVCTRPLKRKAKSPEATAVATASAPRPKTEGPGAEAAAASQTAKPVFSAWRVPDDVASDIANIVDISQGDCGSVEFMYDERGGPPVYFDLNMLSTLPIMDGSVENAEGVWPPSFDPWSQLAAFIVSRSSTPPSKSVA